MEDFTGKTNKKKNIIDIDAEAQKIGTAKKPPSPKRIILKEEAKKLGNIEMYIISRR